MKILIEISHPAHVHYFRNFIKIMKEKGHLIYVIARRKDVTFSLLKFYKIDFISVGKNGKNLLSKLYYLLVSDILLLKISIKFKPDIFLSFSSPYVGHIAYLFRKPNIVFDDTEHAKLEHMMYKPFASSIVTPTFFLKDMGPKHIKVKSLFEYCYIHSSYYVPNRTIYSDLNLIDGERYVILRFISWTAVHDMGHSGISLEIKRRAVKELSRYSKIFISSEDELPADLQKYQLKIAPNKMHDALKYADLFFSESGTMASEAALLGTPSVMVSTLADLLGNFRELRNKYELLFYFNSGEDGLKKALELIKNTSIKEIWETRQTKFIEDNIDFTAFMVWFIEQYPKSISTLHDNPNFQNKFK